MDSYETRRFTFFNHIVDSDIALPELTELKRTGVKDVVPDVSFQVSADQSEFFRDRDWLHHWPSPDQAIALSFSRDSDSLFLHFPGLARFVIANKGKRVTCYIGAPIAQSTIRHLLLDQVLPRLFAHYHSYIVYHSSFLSVNGRGICFLADSGWGKSTIAAGMGTAGNTILNDDCVGIYMKDQKPFGIAPYYGIRLLPDSIEHLGESLRNSEEAVAEYTSKRRIRLEEPYLVCKKNIPLQAFFLLSSPEEGRACREVEIKKVGGLHAMKALLKNTFCLDVHDVRWQKDHFRRVSALVASGMSIYSLRYPRDYSSLHGVVQGIMHTLDQP